MHPNVLGKQLCLDMLEEGFWALKDIAVSCIRSNVFKIYINDYLEPTLYWLVIGV